MENVKILVKEKKYLVPFLWINCEGYYFCEREYILGGKNRKLIDRITPISVKEKDILIEKYVTKKIKKGRF